MDKMIACTMENPCTSMALADPRPAKLMLFGLCVIGFGLMVLLARLIWQYKVNRGL